MKTSDAAFKAGGRPGKTGEGDLFVLVIDREKMIKQLLEVAGDVGSPLEKG